MTSSWGCRHCLGICPKPDPRLAFGRKTRADRPFSGILGRQGRDPRVTLEWNATGITEVGTLGRSSVDGTSLYVPYDHGYVSSCINAACVLGDYSCP